MRAARRFIYTYWPSNLSSPFTCGLRNGCKRLRIVSLCWRNRQGIG